MVAVLMIFTMLVLACIWENLGPSAISGHIFKFWFCLHSLLIFRPKLNFNFYFSSPGLWEGKQVTSWAESEPKRRKNWTHSGESLAHRVVSLQQLVHLRWVPEWKSQAGKWDSREMWKWDSRETRQQSTGLNSVMNTDTDMLPGSYPHRKYIVYMVWNIILWRWEEVSPMRDDDDNNWR